MRLLLDTCTFLWLTLDSEHLSERVRVVLQDPATTVYLSAASVWEICIKYGLGRLPLPEPPERFVPSMRAALQIEPLPVTERACLLGTTLPALHRDPFDRLLVSQALADGLVIATNDSQIVRYPVVTLW